MRCYAKSLLKFRVLFEVNRVKVTPYQNVGKMIEQTSQLHIKILKLEVGTLLQY